MKSLFCLIIFTLITHDVMAMDCLQLKYHEGITFSELLIKKDPEKAVLFFFLSSITAYYRTSKYNWTLARLLLENITLLTKKATQASSKISGDCSDKLWAYLNVFKNSKNAKPDYDALKKIEKAARDNKLSRIKAGTKEYELLQVIKKKASELNKNLRSKDSIAYKVFQKAIKEVIKKKLILIIPGFSIGSSLIYLAEIGQIQDRSSIEFECIGRVAP